VTPHPGSEPNPLTRRAASEDYIQPGSVRLDVVTERDQLDEDQPADVRGDLVELRLNVNRLCIERLECPRRRRVV
jgi:hypothetical protein